MRSAYLLFISITFFVTSCATANANQEITYSSIEGYTQNSDFQSKDITINENNNNELLLGVKHFASITTNAVFQNATTFLTADDAGFVIKHRGNKLFDTYQISDIPIRSISIHPDNEHIAFYESDGFSIHRISVWNWETKTKLYAKRFKDAVTSLSWSAKGNLLMVGNTSIEGITVLEGKTGEIRKIFNSSPGIVTLGLTGASETSMITFGPSGRILYTDVNKGTKRAEYFTDTNIQKPTIFNNNVSIAGILNNSVVIIDATNGKTIQNFPSQDPIFATRSQDIEPIWFERVNELEWIVRQGDVKSTSFELPSPDVKITSTISMENEIIFSINNTLYSIPRESLFLENTAPIPLLQSKNIVIDDIVSDGHRVFLLSEGSLFVITEPTAAPVFATDGLQGNRLTLLDNEILIWSSKEIKTVHAVSFSGEEKRIMYTPTDVITSVFYFSEKIALVESSSKVIILNAKNGQSMYSYQGAGLQEAIMAGDTKLIVSKSSTFNSPYPLILINTSTGETVPFHINGDLCYGVQIKKDDAITLTSFLINNENGNQKTELISSKLNLEEILKSTFTTEAVYGDEDLSAHILLLENSKVTNLGKNSLVEIARNKQNRLSRGHALPLRSVATDTYIVSINYDGSLSWFSKSSLEYIGTTLINDKGMWKSF